MQADEVRFLFAYDRWATRRVLARLEDLDPDAWARPAVGERSLGEILVHHLGASERWRHSFQQSGESPEPELEPLPGVAEMRERWEAEWAAVDEWLATLTDRFVALVFEGVPVWQMNCARREPRHPAPGGGRRDPHRGGSISGRARPVQLLRGAGHHRGPHLRLASKAAPRRWLAALGRATGRIGEGVRPPARPVAFDREAPSCECAVKVGAETTAQLVWILAPRLPEPSLRGDRWLNPRPTR